jgi:signal transduction histidine kinase
MASSQTDVAAEITAFYEVGTALLQTMEVKDVLQLVCDHAASLLSAQGSSIVRYGSQDDVFWIQTAAGSLADSLDHSFPAEGSLSGKALETRGAVIENQVADSSASSHAASLPTAIQRAIVVPLIARGQVLGTLACVKDGTQDPFGDTDLLRLEAFANLAAMALENAQIYQDELLRARALDRLQDRLEEQIRQLKALHQAGVTVTADLDLDDLLELVVEEGRRLTRARYGALGVLNESRDELDRFITVGLTPEERARMGELPSGHGLLGAVIREGKPVRVARAGEDDRAAGTPKHHPSISSFLGVPIRIRDEVFGNLYLTNKEGGGTFTSDDEAVLEMLASYAAVAIENARLFRERDRLIRELESAHRARNRLHAYVNHDVRNALHGVSLWSERMGRICVSPSEQDRQEASGISEKIRRGTEHALRLVTDVLDLARIEEGRFQTWPRKINLADLLGAARDTVAPESEIREVALTLDLPEEGLTLVADPDRVLQITLNLLTNAVKFSPPGSEIVIRAGEASEAPPSWTGERPEGRVVIISVRDQGPGIHQEDLDRIFAEFEQLDDAARRRGTGLGLTLCRNLAHHMGGTILVDSEPGAGSTFSLVLPAGASAEGREGWIG